MDFDQTLYIDNLQLQLAIIFELATLHEVILMLIESEDFTSTYVVQVSTKIDDADLRMCKTYNSIPSTLMLTDYLDDIIEPKKDKQHELHRNKERERLSTVDQQTIVIDVLAEQKSFTVDKEFVINSTSKQIDHVS
ncbi:spectrin beta chain [Schistosoma japonicum]|nr:spectrin beta chain [Schistosoma japonicum]